MTSFEFVFKLYYILISLVNLFSKIYLRKFNVKMKKKTSVKNLTLIFHGKYECIFSYVLNVSGNVKKFENKSMITVYRLFL